LSPEFIFDESVDGRLVRNLQQSFSSTYVVAKEIPSTPDEDIIHLAQKHGAIIVTEDKDFGEWVFAHGAAAPGVIFLRYQHTEILNMTQVLQALLSRGRDALLGQFIVVTTQRLRYRRI